MVLLIDLPEEFLYKGYLCTIIGLFADEKRFYGPNDDPEELQYEIEFESYFNTDDPSRESQKRYSDFEFPMTIRTTIVSGKDIAPLHSQDLYYRTYFLRK